MIIPIKLAIKQYILLSSMIRQTKRETKKVQLKNEMMQLMQAASFIKSL